MWFFSNRKKNLFNTINNPETNPLEEIVLQEKPIYEIEDGVYTHLCPNIKSVVVVYAGPTNVSIRIREKTSDGQPGALRLPGLPFEDRLVRTVNKDYMAKSLEERADIVQKETGYNPLKQYGKKK